MPTLRSMKTQSSLPLLQVRGVSKHFQHAPVLRGVDLDLAAGECFALFGANGAGKSTLLRVLATLQRPNAGQFSICGHDGVSKRDLARQHVFAVAHGSHHYDELSALENLQFALGLRGIKPMPGALEDALSKVGLQAFAGARVRVFSSGMKKRLALAKAMLLNPSLLLLDEPYAALDEIGVALVNDFVRERLAAGAAILMVSHDRQLSAQVASRVGVLRRGKIDECSVEELLEAEDWLQ